MNRKRVKQILKACGNWSQSQEFDIRPVRQQLARATGQLNTSRRIITQSAIRGSITREEHLALQRAVEETRSNLSTLTRWVRDLPFDTQTRESAAPNLDYVDLDEYVIDRKTISFTTEPITFDDVELGRFKVSLNTENGTLIAEALEPNHPQEDSRVTHPNIKNDAICMGEGAGPFSACIRQGLFFHALDIAVSVVRTNGDDSPYVSIENWDGYECGACGDSTTDICRECEEAFCSECQIADTDGYSRCDDCSPPTCCICEAVRFGETCSAYGCYESICGACLDNNHVCPEHRPVCAICEEKHSGDTPCPGCGDSVCDECGWERCHLCDEYKCSNCIDQCHACEEKSCNGCSAIKCEECPEHICGACMQSC